METLNKLLAIDSNYIIIGLVALFFSLEQILDTSIKFNKKAKHLFHNFLFYVVFFLANLLWAAALVFSMGWLNDNQVGLFYLFQLPVWVKLILGIAIFDFVSYWFHRMAHKVPLLWRFHRVHHSDTRMDSTTYFRGHPIEIFFWFSISNILAAGLFGLDLLALGFYYFILTPFLIIEHTNLGFPKWLDNTIGLLFVTPNLHKVHHEQDQYYTDSNFADIFILWDRLFGTYKYLPVKNINYGLKEFDEDKKQTFQYLMLSPFIDIKRITSEKVVNKD
jgi:sterol desaturase/sphingolipid hydroxylase (fatty acid hydroxylase superfamily)